MASVEGEVEEETNQANQKQVQAQAPSSELSEEQREQCAKITTAKIAPQTEITQLTLLHYSPFNALFECMTLPAIVHERNKILQVNKAIETESGYTKDELLRMKISKILKGNLLLKKNGERAKVLIQAITIGDKELLLLNDVSKEELISSKAAELSAINELSNELFLITNKRGKILSVFGNTKIFENFFDGLVGKNIRALLKRKLQPGEKKKLKITAQNGNQKILDVETIQKGERIFYRVSDLTEREELLEGIEKAREKYEQLVDNVSDIIFLIDTEANLQHTNWQFERQLGHKAADVKNLLSIIHHEDVPRFVRTLAEAKENGRPFRDLEFRLQNARKRWIYYSANAVPIKSAGRVVGFSGTLRNIHERKMAEDKSRKIKDQLERDYRQLFELNKLKSEFLSNVSHDLKTPLTSIQGYAALLKERKLNEKDSAEAAEIIHSEAQRLTKMINDLLDLSKLEAGVLTLNLKPIYLSMLEPRCALRKLAEEKGLALIWNTPDSVGQVLADEDRIAQVLLNLISNAIKFTEKGSITINAFATGDFVQVDVIDTGIGIPEKEQKYIFERFYQAQLAKKRKEGSGLGLSIARDIIKLHGGKIWVESKPGVGSKFSFTLPKAKKEKIQQETTTEVTAIAQTQATQTQAEEIKIRVDSLRNEKSDEIKRI